MSGLQGKTVVVADDSPKIRNDIVRRYRDLGMNVVGEYDTGIPVLEHLQQERPDLVSLDIIMPEMDGFEAFRLIKERYPDQKVLFVTWLASDHRIMEKLRGEFDPDAFVAKPVNSQEFHTKVAGAFGVDAPDAPATVSEPVTAEDEAPEISTTGLETSHPESDLSPSDHGGDDDLDVPITAN